MGEIYSENKLSRYERFLIHFCIIDTLFLTYIPVIALSFSVPFTIIWMFNYIRSREYAQDVDRKKYRIFLIIVIISCIIGFLFVNESAVQGAKIALEMLLTTFLYFIFKKYIKYVRIDKYLCAFIYLGAILAIFYFVNRSGFVVFKNFVNPFDGDTLNYLGVSSTNFRYNFLWTDANNPAYMFPTVLFMLFQLTDYSFGKKIFLYICVLIIVVATMSTGGAIAFAVVTVLSVVFGHKQKIQIRRVNVIAFFFSAVMIFAIIAFLPNIIDFANTNETVIQSFERVQDNSASGDQRIQIWKKFIKEKPIYRYVVCGEGPMHIIYGRNAQPHNGFLYLIYAYGWIGAYLFFSIFIIPRRRLIQSWYYFPMIMGIFVNTMMTNPKILGLFFIIKICSDKDFYIVKNENKGEYYK
ncbi:MAG: O-antigen ligase domain-containing protein [Erysipelotrichia bacterium]|nr:O-antigen ligase domain-containing protein [Erysipelotrichia bacterium]